MKAAMKKKLLILGGSGEAFALDKALSENTAIEAITSLAGRTSLPRKPIGPYRTGGFGGVEGLSAYITREKIDAVIDATHPFASRITANAAAAANLTRTPILHIIRPPWQHQPGDSWSIVPDMTAAAAALQPAHSPAFLTIGRLELDAFRPRTDLRFIARAIEPAAGNSAEPFPDNFAFIYGKGPFDLSSEERLINDHGIRAIVTKNSGGHQASAKLAVARKHALPVIMIDRPKPPAGTIVATPEDALRWLRQTLNLNPATK